MFKIIWKKKIHYKLNMNLRFNNIIWGITNITMTTNYIQPQSSVVYAYTLNNLLNEAESQFPDGAILSYFCLYNGIICDSPVNILIHTYEWGYVNGSGETYTIFLHNKGTSVYL